MTRSLAKASEIAPMRLKDYSHSPAHYAVATGDHSKLSNIVSSLPRLADPARIQNESDSLDQERIAEEVAAVLDQRDVPLRETPLHLAVRLNDIYAVNLLASAGADISLQNAAGWNALQEAFCSRRMEVAMLLLRIHHKSAWYKWRRRLPRLRAVLHRMRDFYMEISFHFESSLVPFVGCIVPSDTYRIWKRDANLRADTSLAGFDGLKIQRSNQSFLFIGDGDSNFNLSPGSLLVLNRDEKKIYDAFESAESPLSASDEEGFRLQTSVHQPGMDVTRAELVSQTNWRRQHRTETMGEWKTKVFDIHNVVFSFRTRNVTANTLSIDDAEDRDCSSFTQVSPLEIDEDSEEGFLVAEIPSTDPRRRHSSFEKRDYCYRQNEGRTGRENNTAARRSVDFQEKIVRASEVKKMEKKNKESEYVKNLKPSVWLTEQFPLSMEEILPLLDILANKVKAVRRLRELLTTKFPPATFPVKISIPVVPTVRVVITFSKFMDLEPSEIFFTPSSSPGNLQSSIDETEEEEEEEKITWRSRLKFKNNHSTKQSNSRNNPKSPLTQPADPFAIPTDYTWASFEAKNTEIKKSKSRKNKATRSDRG